MLDSPEWKDRNPHDINNGSCDEFAEALQEELEDREIESAFYCTLNFVGHGDLPDHAWVFAEGRHYDAEHPDGVTHWLDLKIFSESNYTTEASDELKIRQRFLKQALRDNSDFNVHGLLFSEAYTGESGEEYAVRKFGPLSIYYKG